MPKHSVHSVKKTDEEKQKYQSFSENTEKVVEQVQNSTVAIKLMFDAKVNAKGNVTGNVYVFNGAGSTVDVDERDAEQLLQKRRGGRSCCGGTKEGVPMFSLA